MISFYLANKDRKSSQIVMYIFFGGKKYSTYIGETVDTDIWSPKKKRAKVLNGDVEAELLNSRLDKWEEAADQAVDYFKKNVWIPEREEMVGMVRDYYSNGKSSDKHVSIVDYMDTFIARYDGQRSVSRIKHFRLLKHNLERFQKETGKTYYFEDLTPEFHRDLKEWFFNEENNYCTNYFGEQIRILKQVAEEAKIVDGIHNFDGYKRKAYEVKLVEVENVYLNEDELMSIHRLDITDELVKAEHPNYDIRQVQERVKSLKKARDMFLIGAYTGLRFSDFSRLKEYNFKDSIKVVSRKTGIRSVIPIHWVIKEIIERGYDFEHPLYEQKLNTHIKEVCKLAGIDEDVMLIKSRGGQFVEEVSKKYELVSTHTARRSFATNAYKAGIPTLAIMKVTGHKRESSFLKYIKVSEDENADMLKNTSFFSKEKED